MFKSEKNKESRHEKPQKTKTAMAHFCTEKETRKGKYKNLKVQKSKRCEIVKSNNIIIQKSKSSNMQKM